VWTTLTHTPTIMITLLTFIIFALSPFDIDLSAWNTVS